jgi:hypothetical protein
LVLLHPLALCALVPLPPLLLVVVAVHPLGMPNQSTAALPLPLLWHAHHCWAHLRLDQRQQWLQQQQQQQPRAPAAVAVQPSGSG